MTLALDEIAEQWLFPRGRAGTLVAALESRNRRDRELIKRVAGAHGGSWAVLDRALDLRPESQSRLVGVAGARLAMDATAERRAGLEQAIAGMVAEVAAAAGIRAVLPAGNGPLVSLPNSRCLVRFPQPCGPVTVHVDRGEVVVRAGTAQAAFANRGSNEPGLVPLSGNEFVEHLPDTGEIMLEIGGISSTIALPPRFRLVQAVPTEEQTAQLRQALTILARTSPALYEEMLAFPVRITLMERAKQRLSLTADGLPDLVYTNLVNPLETVDLLVHEYHHLKLELLQETTSLLRHPATPVVAPWRPDVRTANGVLHGAYVFANVAKAFDPIMAMAKPSVQGRRRRAVWRAAVLRSIELLRDSDAGITEAGQQLVDGMAAAARGWCLEHADTEGEQIRWATAEVDRHVRDVELGRRPEPLYMAGALRPGTD